MTATTPPPEPIRDRRASDAQVAGLQRDIALLSQRVELTEKAEDARATAIQKGLEGLGLRMDTILSVVSAMREDPDSTPAGRALTGAISAHEGRLRALEKESELTEQWRNEATGAIRTIRATVVVLTLVTGFLSALAAVAAMLPG